MSIATLGRAFIVATGTTLTVGPSTVAEVQTGAPPVAVGEVFSSAAQDVVVTSGALATDLAAARRAALDELTALSDELGLYD
jgi:hypothetical protein